MERSMIFLLLILVLTILDGLYPQFLLKYFLIAAIFYLHLLREREHLKTDWENIHEIGLIFICLLTVATPMILMLQNQESKNFLTDTLHLLKTKASHKAFWYFWVSGICSAFIDNVPTYLMLFKTLDLSDKSIEITKILTGLSAGSVFMGGLSYLGNTPNLIIKKMAQEKGVAMPSFFGYMLYSTALLLPLFCIYSAIFLW
jgi:Na+/H+ antiporter NhaD/arsenite permease-like protein